MTALLQILAMTVVIISKGYNAEDADDAWKVIQNFEKQYLAYTTNSQTFFECLTLKRQTLESSNKSAMFAATFEVADSTNKLHLDVLQIVNGAPDSIDMRVTLLDIEQELHETVKYSDYKTCYITVLPSGSKVCHLWMSLNSTKKEVKACMNRLDDPVCEGDVTDVFQKEKCGDPK